MLCKSCGTPNQDNAELCSGCGESLPKTTQTTALADDMIRSSGSPWSYVPMALLITISIMGIAGLFAATVWKGAMWIAILGTSLWAAVDSSKIKLSTYKSQIASGPITLFIGCVFLWIIGFPWYLTVRHNILSGIIQSRK